MTDHSYLELRMPQVHIRDQGIRKVVEIALPALIVYPSKYSVHPYSEAERVARTVVLLTDMRPVQVPKLVFAIKVHQQGTVTHRYITGHTESFVSLSFINAIDS